MVLSSEEYFFTIPFEDWKKLKSGLYDYQLYAKSKLKTEVNYNDKVHFSSLNNYSWIKIPFYNTSSSVITFHNGEKWLKNNY